MNPREILIVDDDRSLLEQVKGELGMEQFAVRTACNVPEAMDRLRQAPHPDVMILDISLAPGPAASGFSPSGANGDLPGDGLGLLRLLRRDTDLPVIMLSGTRAESIKVLALDLGADDYVTKPFGGRELAARVRAVLRRAAPAAEEALRFKLPGFTGDGQATLLIDPARHTVLVDAEPVTLTRTEFGILSSLARAHGRVLTRSQLLDMALGTGHWVSERTVDVHVRRLREKLEPDPGAPEIVLTVRGFGYRFGL